MKEIKELIMWDTTGELDCYGQEMGHLIRLSPAEALLHPKDEIRERAEEMLKDQDKYEVWIKYEGDPAWK